VRDKLWAAKEAIIYFFKLFIGSGIALLSISFVPSQDALGDGVMTEVSETSQEGASRIRHLTLGDGSKIVERMDAGRYRSGIINRRSK
jgi:hypothetical protein